jgi:hypothetical protein
MEEMMTEQDIATILGTTMSSVTTWRTRGYFHHYSTSPTGEVLVSELAFQVWMDTLRPWPKD